MEGKERQAAKEFANLNLEGTAITLRLMKPWFASGKTKPRGGHILLKSEVSPAGTRHEPILALGWYDAKAKFIVSSCGSTVAGKPSVRPRTRVEVQNGDLATVAYSKLVPRPKVVEEFFTTFSNIDVHDHYRQGSLEMERLWATRNWTHRIFTTILGVCIVDAFLAYEYEATSNHRQPEDFTFFCGRLSRL
jgi:hypothetical protein